MKTIYFIKQEKTNAVLIGQNEGYPYSQLSLAESMSPYGCELIGTITGGNDLAAILSLFHDRWISGMWYDIDKIYITRLNGFEPSKVSITVGTMKQAPKKALDEVIKQRYELNPQFNRCHLAEELGVSRQTIHNHVRKIESH